MWHWLTSVVLVLVVLTTAATAQVVSYETFMKQAADKRRETWRTLAPEQKAVLMRAHAERYLAKHRSELTLDQATFLEESIRSISPALYQHPVPEEARQRRAEIDMRARALFSREQGRQAFTLDGDYIPPLQ